MNTLQELDKYVRLQKAAIVRGKERARETRSASPPPPVSQSLARPRERALDARRAFAFTRPLDYAIPGVVDALRQPSKMACWATSFTMMVGWRDQRSYSIEDALRLVDPKWIAVFNADTGTTSDQEAEFYAASGLVAEPLANPTLEHWEQMLRSYGPLAVVIDVDPGERRAMHMVIVIGIHGDGTADGTTLTVVDPARGANNTVRFADFVRQYDARRAAATTRSSTGLRT
jgi:hypothetical protein